MTSRVSRSCGQTDREQYDDAKVPDLDIEGVASERLEEASHTQVKWVGLKRQQDKPDLTKGKSRKDHSGQ